ncbi:CC0125/CC1285 family lipoprotein [Sinimarinibacterium thermocellulolyticum]|uniref:Lipoprotein n=1 Tax=Sinimarinibacterium thermocellulolyticum TaxID=3170016 RepID=A0ABV2A989_9GAMM
MSRLPLVFLLCAALGAACAGRATPYQPVTNGYGYSEQRLEQDRYRVSFFGNARTDAETVTNYVLYRAAEITLDQGYDYFVVIDRSTQGQQPAGGGPSVGVGLGAFRFGGSGGFGISIGTTTSVGGGGGDAYRGTADILLRKGDKPADDVQAFDARAVKANLQDRIVRPRLNLR